MSVDESDRLLDRIELHCLKPQFRYNHRHEPGDVTLYDASVLHRGGRNSATRSRPTFQISLAGEGAAPTGIPYTVFVDDLIATLGEAT